MSLSQSCRYWFINTVSSVCSYVNYNLKQYIPDLISTLTTQDFFFFHFQNYMYPFFKNAFSYLVLVLHLNGVNSF